MGTADDTGTALHLPELDSAYELGFDAHQRFERDGFVRLGGVLTEEAIARVEPVITDKVIELNTMHLPMHERSTYDKAFLQVTNLWQHSRLVRRLVQSTRLARIAAELMGVDAVRLYHDQALYKETNGGITPWHADQYYWPLSSDRTCTAWIPLQETPFEMGPLEFAIGSQRVEVGRDLPIGEESEAAMQRSLAEQGFRTSSAPYAVGDVSYHMGWTFHRAGPNAADSPRRVMTIIYMDADITVTDPANANERHDLEAWMPGAVPGSAPDTPLNPVLYRRSGIT